MIAITNPKIAGFTPRWAYFPGFSLLLDNPLDETSPWGDSLRLLDCRVGSNPQAGFYRGLAAGLQKIGADLLTQTYLFCPTPPSTYHVTVWDGLNAGNAAQVTNQHAGALADFLKDIEKRFGDDSPFTTPALASPLVKRDDWRISFRLEAVEKWSNIGLMARLAPADEASRQRLAEVMETRQALSVLYRERFGMAMSKTWVPHVTLGYFANQQQAELSSPQLPSWNEQFQRAVGEELITYDTIALYGFKDMVTFFKS